jgi:hypothetical protein
LISIDLSFLVEELTLSSGHQRNRFRKTVLLASSKMCEVWLVAVAFFAGELLQLALEQSPANENRCSAVGERTRSILRSLHRLR